MHSLIAAGGSHDWNLLPSFSKLHGRRAGRELGATRELDTCVLAWGAWAHEHMGAWGTLRPPVTLRAAGARA